VGFRHRLERDHYPADDRPVPADDEPSAAGVPRRSLSADRRRAALRGALPLAARAWKFGKSTCTIDALPIAVGESAARPRASRVARHRNARRHRAGENRLGPQQARREARLTDNSTRSLARYIPSRDDADVLAAKIWYAIGRK